jgi:hypothetical protein
MILLRVNSLIFNSLYYIYYIKDMRNLLIISLFLTLAIAACNNDDNNVSYKEVTVDMGSGSGSDVYYSLAGGAANTVNRNDWDIAFSVPVQTATILINEGKGLELYCVGDTNVWESINASTISGLKPRFNNKSDWAIGAFNLNASSQTNFGWGTYHQAEHNVGGDSSYIIKYPDGSLKKLMIRVKLGATSDNVIRFADADGNNESVETISTTPYVGLKNFIHYSLVNKAVVEAEPKFDAWDLIFTRYVIQIPTGPSSVMNYPVTGVLCNSGVTVAKVTGVPAEKAVDTQSESGYVAAADVIGYDWKVSDPVTHAVSIADSVSYFIKSVDGKKYQMYFTDYGGLEAGTITIKVKTVQ